VCVGSEDDRVRGVACLGAPASFAGWAHDGGAIVELARQIGIIRTPGFPSDLRPWSAAFTTLSPDKAAARINPRPLLVVHGSDDDEVPVSDGRVLADAAGAGAELRVILGAGHRLLADPRAVALLAGWLERQRPGRA
jgi:putative redox protein